MTSARPEVDVPRQQAPAAVDPETWGAASGREAAPRAAGRPSDQPGPGSAISPVRKAAIVLVSLDQSLASQLLSHLDRSAVESVTWEIARLERIEPAERAAVLEEFYGLGLRRLCFVFDDLVKMNDGDIRAAFHEEDSQTWALALAGAAANVRAKVLEALSSVTADRLSAQLHQLGPFRLSDSETAQLEITERLRRLYDHGRISLPEPNGQDEVLV
ncbi:MAG: FliG C-terminal domain-containing protein [Isosphaeraceae bacterium]